MLPSADEIREMNRPENSSLSLWMRSEVLASPSWRVSSSDVYAHYKAWCEARKLYAFPHRLVVRQLLAAGFTRAKTAKARYLVGLRINGH